MAIGTHLLMHFRTISLSARDLNPMNPLEACRGASVLIDMGKIVIETAETIKTIIERYLLIFNYIY